ncbi:hypothetical protein Fcan01_09197 [Folsomia candida]|uniref:Uncharacterized protein n=1 Tax=Folsomia candida TaxID=158441 RepID=A0A226EHJ8_FOLCA|nr:hypothetical protein Fcan01_09197 [Folsomia candida]
MTIKAMEIRRRSHSNQAHHIIHFLPSKNRIKHITSYTLISLTPHSIFLNVLLRDDRNQWLSSALVLAAVGSSPRCRPGWASGRNEVLMTAIHHPHAEGAAKPRTVRANKCTRSKCRIS